MSPMKINLWCLLAFLGFAFEVRGRCFESKVFRWTIPGKWTLLFCPKTCPWFALPFAFIESQAATFSATKTERKLRQHSMAAIVANTNNRARRWNLGAFVRAHILSAVVVTTSNQSESDSKEVASLYCGLFCHSFVHCSISGRRRPACHVCDCVVSGVTLPPGAV